MCKGNLLSLPNVNQAMPCAFEHFLFGGGAGEAGPDLVASCLQPMDNHQAMVRRESVINLENFKKQYARRRWKLTYSIVALCNHLSRSLVQKVRLMQEDSLKQEGQSSLLVRLNQTEPGGFHPLDPAPLRK